MIERWDDDGRSAHAQPEPVYNLQVEGEPEYFANGVLVHNCSFTGAPNEASPDRLDAYVHAMSEFVGRSLRAPDAVEGVVRYDEAGAGVVRWQ